MTDTITPVRESAIPHTMDETDVLAAMRKAGLTGWDVQKVPMYADLRGYDQSDLVGEPVRGRVDDSTFKTVGKIGGQLAMLGTVGDQYQPVQNEQHAGFMAEVIKQADAKVVGAQAFKGGRLVYVTMELPETVLVGGRDPVKMYLNGINSHDGSTHFMMNLSPERAWCANQLPYFRKISYKMRHSGNVENKIRDARKALDITFKNVEDFRVWSERLADTSMSLSQFESVIDSVYPVPEAPGEIGHSARTWNNYTKLRDGFDEMWVSAANAGIHGTAWGGLQATVEHLEWVHGSDRGRSERIMTSGDLEKKTGKLYEAFKAFALAA